MKNEQVIQSVEEIKALTDLVKEAKSHPQKVRKITIEWSVVLSSTKPKITIEYE